MVASVRHSTTSEQLDHSTAKGIPLMRTRVQTKNYPTTSLRVSTDSSIQSRPAKYGKDTAKAATCGTNTSKLKASTITRVPPDKSCIRKPSTTSSTSPSSSTTSLETSIHRKNSNDSEQPSATARTAAKISVSEQVYRRESSKQDVSDLVRNSMQNCPPKSRLVLPKATKLSVLPRLVRKLDSDDRSLGDNRDHTRCDQTGNEKKALSCERRKNEKNKFKTLSKTCEPNEKSITARNPLGNAQGKSLQNLLGLVFYT